MFVSRSAHLGTMGSLNVMRIRLRGKYFGQIARTNVVGENGNSLLLRNGVLRWCSSHVILLVSFSS